MLLLLHWKIWNTPPTDWTACNVARMIFGSNKEAVHLWADAETLQSPSTGHTPSTSRASWSEWIPFDHVILIGALHLSFMVALGIVSLFVHNIPIESGALRVFSLVAYEVVLIPYLKLILPVALIFGPYFGYLLHKTQEATTVQEAHKTTSIDETRKAATAWDLSIARNESRQEDLDGVWTFGQTLALILLLLPLGDAAENILQRSEKRLQRRLSVKDAVGNLGLYQDRVPWETVENWVKIISTAPVEPHQLWLRRAAAQNKMKFVQFLLNNGVDAKDQPYPRQADVSQPQDKVNSLPFLMEKAFDAKNEGLKY
ncbi:hypothetical protein B0H13DRAFT_2335469 [Mycena leptocephala]|nr:hypothetical protein B0H13DRAFT_2335469 [Mycena leptocephala]